MVTANGTTCQQRSVETTLAGLLDKATLAPAEPIGPLAGPLVVTIGKTVANRAKLNWWESRALYGWTVLVPRTKDQAGEMSDRLVGHGALPIEVPTIAVEPPRSPAQMERAVKGLVDGRFQWVVFTSTNAVRAVWEKFNEFGLDARAFSGVKIACVGQATADRVRAFGINPELVPSGEQSSLGLLDEFPHYDDIFDPVNRVLLPRADIATETLAEGLRERGWEIEDVTAYRTVRAAPPPAQTREMIKTGGFDAVCFTSSSTVRNLVGIAGKPHARTIVACIGPKTAETAAEFGLRVDVQPETAADRPAGRGAGRARRPAARRGCAAAAAQEEPPPLNSAETAFQQARTRASPAGMRFRERRRISGISQAPAAAVAFHPGSASVEFRNITGATASGAADVRRRRHCPSRVPIASMPGVVQHTRESLRRAAAEAVAAGVGGLMMFGVPCEADKDATGSAGIDPDGILNRRAAGPEFGSG